LAGIQYIGETLWPGQLGHFCIILSFISALFAAAAYYLHIKQSDDHNSSWRNFGRYGFIVHSFSTFVVIGILFYIMVNAMYEYNYVHGHVSDDLPMKYIFSAFWEGQEGSFLLWMFWHIILGLFFIFKKDAWEPSVVMILSLVNLIMMSMLLGLHIPIGAEEFKIGSNPTLLLRDVMDAPIFSNADYLSLIEGRGLNPLLQNYWMTIHPPVLFLGFASTAIPFGFAIGGLLKRDHKGWLVPALKWSLFSSFFLGTGILMGAAWAYEALGFGGYWAWDPVENASFVPWITLVAGIHTNLVARNTGYSVRSTYAFYLMSFVLIIYSTFLTRSGILGDTSAHSFTEMGLEWQLVGLVSFFALMAIYFLASRYKGIPTKQKEESISSREFWMLIGSIVLFFSALLISVSTSLPVFNSIVEKVYDPNYLGAVIEDPIEHYNKYQLWIGVFIGLLSAAAQYLRYGARNWDTYRKKFISHLLIAAIVSAVLSVFVYRLLNNAHWQHFLLLYSGLFAIVSNLDYLITFTKFNPKASASVMSHLGFGILILGVMFSGLNKEYISSDPFAQRGLMSNEMAETNLLLYKNSPYLVKEHWIEYKSDTVIDNLKYFEVAYKRVDEKNDILEEFSVQPSGIYDINFANINAWNPDTKHYWNKDIFTTISGYPPHLRHIDSLKVMEDTMLFDYHRVAYADTFHIGKSIGQFGGYNFAPNHPKVNLDSVDLAIGATVSFAHPLMDTTYTVEPALVLKDGLIYQHHVSIDPLGLRVILDDSNFDRVFTQESSLNYNELLMKEGESVNLGAVSMQLLGFDRSPENKKYESQKDDIALAALLSIRDNATGEMFQAKPIYIIRGNKQFSIKDYQPDLGLHIRFNSIDPKSEIMTFNIAQEERDLSEVMLKIAENVPRSDLIVIESIVFPMIKLVWIGTIMMLLGLMMGLWIRYKH